jgi:hypothetical protein
MGVDSSPARGPAKTGVDMAEDRQTEQQAGEVNVGYVGFQLAKALVASQGEDDPAVREQAEARIAKWRSVLENVILGSVDIGSRTPIEGVPAWATPEVVTGGFVTGALLAGGRLRPHEELLLKQLSRVRTGDERRAVNAHFLSDAGIAALVEQLRIGSYDIDVPEEGALLVVAWLVENGFVEESRGLLDAISPHFASLRFYPIPLDRPRQFGSRVHLKDVRDTVTDLQGTKANAHILAQKEAVEVWAPFFDRMVAIFVETIEDDWPCRKYSEAWQQRARELLADYSRLREQHRICGKPDRAKGHFSQLRTLLAKCANDRTSLAGRDVARVRLILTRSIQKRGRPDSQECEVARRRQRLDVIGPAYCDIARIVISRLKSHLPTEGIDDVSLIKTPVDRSESTTSGIPEGTAIPESIQRKIDRCLDETVTVLVDRGIITSAETLARVLPQITAGIRAAGIADPNLRQLYAAIYRAFRRRRSLLLLNLEKQVQINELPWVSSIERFRKESLPSLALARQTLEEVARLSITSFPHAILPNKLLQELRALINSAGLQIPLVDEVAADIFMGEFSAKFVESAKCAARIINGTLYARYYDIDCSRIMNLPLPPQSVSRNWLSRRKGREGDAFVKLCAFRARAPLGTWDAATNGTIIEQQQILTTQNLAALFDGLGLLRQVGDQLDDMAKRCFIWICKRQQMKIDRRHARLIMLKNTAYAWRQMIFYLAMLSEGPVEDFLCWAGEHLREQREGFRTKFRPALDGLVFVARGGSINESSAKIGTRRFLGWSRSPHWLLHNG